MIRRDSPRTDARTHWLLIPQREHARLSFELAQAWRPRLLADSDARAELLQAIRVHDAGWADWEQAPEIDPAHGRPYGFTEMPPHDAQRIWDGSIRAGRDVGPLAGWVVAGHFVRLQSQQDQDHAEWRDWLAPRERDRAAWLDEWQAQSTDHTLELAEHALCLLRTFDWLSLWLCCRAPLDAHDPAEAMTLDDAGHGFGPYRLTGEAGRVRVEPWPFAAGGLDLRVPALRVPVGKYADTRQMLAAASGVAVAWRVER